MPDDDVELIARGSQRGWSDIDGRMTSAEADWLVTHGRYAMVCKALLRPISVEAMDRALDRERWE